MANSQWVSAQIWRQGTGLLHPQPPPGPPPAHIVAEAAALAEAERIAAANAAATALAERARFEQWLMELPPGQLIRFFLLT